ncbi:MAG TPA: tetratricopeptide repeat protein [bacterium]|nr:tetratricopeptide repeat protein [bacterium]
MAERPDELKKKKHLENVGKHLEKGNLDRAIKELGKLLELDPEDVKARLKMGDLQTKKGDRKAAAECYLEAAKKFEASGRLLEASTVYKQILRLDNNNIDAQITLAGLCKKLGLTSDAVSHYHIAAQLYDAKGDSAKALEVFKLITQVDPNDVLARKRASELAARGGKAADAVGELARAASDLRRKGRTEELAKVLEKIGHLDPSNAEVMRELASIYLGAGDAKKALARLQNAFRENPNDLETLELLAEIFRSMGRPEKAESVEGEIARLRAAG